MSWWNERNRMSERERERVKQRVKEEREKEIRAKKKMDKYVNERDMKLIKL
jgi:hypothetical protein